MAYMKLRVAVWTVSAYCLLEFARLAVRTSLGWSRSSNFRRYIQESRNHNLYVWLHCGAFVFPRPSGKPSGTCAHSRVRQVPLRMLLLKGRNSTRWLALQTDETNRSATMVVWSIVFLQTKR